MTKQMCATGLVLSMLAGTALAASEGAGSAPVRGAMLRAASGAGLPAEALAALKRNALLPGMEDRPEVFHRWLHTGAMCFKYPQTPEEWDEVINVFHARPPTGDQWMDPMLEFFSTSSVWANDVTLSTSLRAVPARLTYSFPADGVNWGTDGQFADGPNVLNVALEPLFGASNVDRAKELVRAAFANYRRNSGLKYDEVADDGTSYFTSATRFPGVGDIRIGGIPLNSSSVLAYNNFPSSGGDMVINTDTLESGGTLRNTFSSHLTFRNVIAHEHGHGTGFFHTIPCQSNKLMEPFIFVNDLMPMMNRDDIRGAQRNYGDRFAGNNSVANAVNFGNLTSPAVRSIIEKDLSTNGASGFNSSSLDWFKFTLSSDQTVTVQVTPTGVNQNIGSQTTDCVGTGTAVDALMAGNLELNIRDAAGVVTLFSSNNAIGLAETLTQTLVAGTYSIRVRQQSDGAAANLVVQTYDLLIRVGTSKAPPQAIAGVNKRCPANTNCWFLGGLNSRVNEAGASISRYDWDLDGDGVFEVANVMNTSRPYTSSGVYPVTLLLTDNQMSTDTDTITVTVFGGVTSVAAASPDSGDVDTTVPITLTGNNFKTVTTAGQVVVSGSGVTVMGTPVSNTLGTQLTGLSLMIDPGAAAGPRDITVTSSGSVGSGVGVFTVVSAPTCTLDYNVDGSTNPDDLGDFITDYYTVPHIPGPGGYAIACPENEPPYDAGYKAGFVPGGGGQCDAPFPDNLGDFITSYYGGEC
ncbi:MAG: PKD domain-containing protein [Phycisphaerales bacterium]